MEASVIVPCRQASAFAPAMASMLAAQTFRGEWEALFVSDEDPGRDGWRAQVEAKGFRTVASRGRGASAARNTGLDAAQGGIVLFADVDDEVPDTWLASMVEAVSGVDLAWCGANVRHPDGHEVSSRAGIDGPADGSVLKGDAIRDFVWRRCFGYRLRDLPRALLPGGLWRNCSRELGSVCWRAFRREVVGGLRFVEGLRNGEDSVFLCAYALKARTMRVSGNCGYTYVRRNGGSLATENSSSRLKLEGKFALRDARRAVDPSMSHWRGTFLLSTAEVLRLGGVAAALRYLGGRGAGA